MQLKDGICMKRTRSWMIEDLKKSSPCFAQRWFYLDVFACGVFVTSKNVPGAPARARQCRPTGRRAQGIFGAEWPSTRPNEVVVRAAGKTCCLKFRDHRGNIAEAKDGKAILMSAGNL
jgi:hypothetical protein